MRYILSPLIAFGEGVGGGVLVPHNIGKCCNAPLVNSAVFSAMVDFIAKDKNTSPEPVAATFGISAVEPARRRTNPITVELGTFLDTEKLAGDPVKLIRMWAAVKAVKLLFKELIFSRKSLD
jgi:hypothetical protein